VFGTVSNGLLREIMTTFRAAASNDAGQHEKAAVRKTPSAFGAANEPQAIDKQDRH
jgi:hypothetical protein